MFDCAVLEQQQLKLYHTVAKILGGSIYTNLSLPTTSLIVSLTIKLIENSRS